MKRLTKGILIVTIAAVAIGLMALTAPMIMFVLEAKEMVDQAKQSRERLFYETDYEQLLVACRELSRRVAEGELEPKKYLLSDFWGDPDPNASAFPQAVLDLEPSVVCIDTDGIVRLELLAGPEYFGVHAGPQSWGDVRLIDDLWYYDSGYSTNPKYRTRIDRMIEESRTHRATQSRAHGAP